MSSIRERVERCAMHPDAVYELVRSCIMECSGIAAAIEGDLSWRSDRYHDYDRGQIAAARHIARRIQGLLP
jgi:hypothetical protein